MEKTIIITGGSKGLGFQTACFIAKDQQISLVIANRNLKKTETAIAQIRKSTGNPNLYGLTLDLTDFDSIKSFVEQFEGLGLPPLFALINNAGIQYISATQYTSQGYEKTFGANHLGHFLLTQLLLPRVIDGGKIINVASGVHNPEMTTGMPNPNYTNAKDIAFPSGQDNGKGLRYLGQQRYSTSKLCNILFTYKLSEVLTAQQRDIQVFAFDPGMMPGTGLADDYPALMRFIWKRILPVQTLLGNRINTPKQSGKVLADWALKVVTEQPTAYFYVGGEELSSKDSYNKALQNDLWSFSMEQTKEWITA